MLPLSSHSAHIHLSIFPFFSTFLHIFSSRVSGWACSCVTQVTNNWDNTGGNWALDEPSPDACYCAFLCFRSPVCMPMRTVGHTLAYVQAHARLASSARSGFNWLISTLLTLTVSVVQTLSRSHRLQQAPPLSIKANPLSPARWRWSND